MTRSRGWKRTIAGPRNGQAPHFAAWDGRGQPNSSISPQNRRGTCDYARTWCTVNCRRTPPDKRLQKTWMTTSRLPDFLWRIRSALFRIVEQPKQERRQATTGRTRTTRCVLKRHDDHGRQQQFLNSSAATMPRLRRVAEAMSHQAHLQAFSSPIRTAARPSQTIDAEARASRSRRRWVGCVRASKTPHRTARSMAARLGHRAITSSPADRRRRLRHRLQGEQETPVKRRSR